MIKQFTSERILPSLSNYVRIPNLSPQFDSEWQQNGLLEKACSHLYNWVLEQKVPNLSIRKLKLENVPEAIHIKIQGIGDQTVLFYGHYDKQPHFTGWREGLHPTEPVIINNRMYGRGCADDGYSIYASIASVILAKQHPNIEMLIEGEEESGSLSLMKYFDMLNLKVDYLVALDSGAGDYERLWLTSSLRGSIKLDLTVNVLTEGVHSGDAGGVVPSAFNIARRLLDRLEDPHTGRCNQGLFSTIPADRYAEVLATAELLHTEFPLQCDIVTKDPIELYLNRTWRPTLCVIGQQGLPSSNGGNVALPYLTLRLSIRVPPNKDAKEAAQFIKELLTRDPPYNADVKVNIITAANGLNAKPFSERLINSLNQSSIEFFNGQELKVRHEGGSIPFLNQLQSRFPDAQLIIMGVLGPGSNAHGPNEMLDINYMNGIIHSLSQLLGQIANE